MSIGAWSMFIPFCIQYIPKDFNRAIRFPIAAMGEMFEHPHSYERLAKSQRPKLRLKDPGQMAGYFNNEMSETMLDNGWCLSDIARCEAKFESL